MFYYLKNKSDKKIVLKSLNVEIEPHGVVRVKKVHFIKNYTKYKKDPFAINVMLVGAAIYKEWVKKNNKKENKDEPKTTVIKNENVSGNDLGNVNENKNVAIDNENESQDANEKNETENKNINEEKDSKETKEVKDTEVKKPTNKKSGTSKRNTSKANSKTSARPSKKQ